MSDREAAIDGLVLAMCAATNANGLYPQSHPLVVEALDRLDASLAGALREQERDDITLLVIDDDFAVDGEPWRRASSHHQGLVRVLQRVGVEHLTMSQGVDNAELGQLVAALSGQGEPVGSEHVRIARVHLEERAAGATRAPSGLEGALDAVHSSIEAVLQSTARAFPQLERAVWDLLEATAGESRTFALLAEVRNVQDRLWRHSINVSLYSMHLARTLGLGANAVHELALGALLHDIGMLSMPAEFLQSGRKLDQDERLRMRQHTELGAVHLAGMEGVSSVAVLVAYEHHMHFDGSGGYPQQGLRRPNLASQVTAVADTYDMVRMALASKPRNIRHLTAIRALRERSGTVLHPFLVATFVELMESSIAERRSRLGVEGEKR